MGRERGNVGLEHLSQSARRAPGRGVRGAAGRWGEGSRPQGTLPPGRCPKKRPAALGTGEGPRPHGRRETQG